jgi:3-oxoacyl-[acyl-carrier-protein] synthase II
VSDQTTARPEQRQLDTKQVVVSGLGAVSPTGSDVGTTWESILAGRSGIGRLTRFAAAESECAIAGEVRDFEPTKWLPAKTIRHADRSVQFGVIAALEALSDAGLAGGSLGPRAGVIFGSSLGGHGVLEAQNAVLEEQGPRRVSPFMLPNLLPDAASGYIAILAGATGPNMAVLSASATGSSAIGEAAEIIRRGDADVMIAGAAEAPLTPVLYAGFAAMRTLAEAGDDPAHACRPFDLNRTGFVIGEGAGAVVLESREHAVARGARVYAELAGYGSGNDAFDIVASEPSGRGAALAMSAGLRKAGIKPEQVSYINAHGTASEMNDRVETAAIKKAFGDHAYRLAVSSTKSMTGHLMGAAGALEAVITILSLYHSILPPTINYETPDPDCDLDYVPNKARPAPGIEAALSHSVGLGGHNASLVFRRFQPAPEQRLR